MYSLRSRNSVPLVQQKLEFPIRKRRQDSTEKITSPSKKSPCKPTEALVRKRRQESKVLQENVSPSKKDKSNGYFEKPTACRRLCKLREPLHDKNKSINEGAVIDQKLDTKQTDVSHIITPIGRDREIESLESFLLSHIQNQRPGSLYISGPPGTGKTFTLNHLLSQKKHLLKGVKVVVLNCMRTRSSQNIFSQIAMQLKVQEKPVERGLTNLFTTSDSMFLIVLDEIDNLSSRGQQTLYTLFELPTLANSRLILIGIANSLDLTDRVLPRLKAHLHASPELLTFAPYEKDQIVDILRNGLQLPVINEPAIQFCARKVATKDGDIRKALDIYRKAIEAQTDSSKVSIANISRVFEEVYGINVRDVTDTIPLHQKLVACSILLMVQGKSNKEVPLGKVYKTYESVCRQQHLRYESQSEFVSLLEMLDMRGIVQIKKNKETFLQHKVRLQLQESELSHVLQDHDLISSVLQKSL